MNIRILSGILVPRKGSGVATVSLHPFSVTGDADVNDPKSVGPETAFKALPTKLVSLKKIEVADKNTFFGGSETDMFSIEEHFANTSTLVIKWNSSGGSKIREIGFMIIGETLS